MHPCLDDRSREGASIGDAGDIPAIVERQDGYVAEATGSVAYEESSLGSNLLREI